MTLISSGPLGLKDAGTNTSNTTRLSTTLTIGSTSVDGYQSSRRLYSESGYSYYLYNGDKIFDGTFYGFRVANDGTMEDTGWTNSGQVSGLYYGHSVNSSLESNSHVTSSGFTVYGAKIGWDMSVANSSSIGSLGSNSFQSDSGASLTIRDIMWLQNTSSNTGNNGNLLVFSLHSLSGVVNADSASFTSITINGNTFTRSSATFVLQSGNATWYWVPTDSQLNSMGTSGNKSFSVNGANQTLNNGIQEEMGPSDSDPVNFSDYYKGGPNHNTTGIATSGALSMNSFYGKTRVAPGTSFSFTGASQSFGKVGQRHGFLTSTSLGSNMSPSSYDFPGGGNLSTTACVANTPNPTLQFFATINSGTVNTTGWTNLKLKKGGTTYTYPRANATQNFVSGGVYYVTWALTTNGNNASNTRSLLGSGTVTVEIE